MKNARFLMLVGIIATAACSGGGGGSQPSGEPSASPPPAAATPAQTPGALTTAAPVPSGEPTVEPTATPDPDLLSPQNGTIVRTSSKELTQSPDRFYSEGSDVQTDSHGPYTVVWELAGVADLTQVGIGFDSVGQDKRGPVATFAASTTGPDSGFADIATLKGTADSSTPSAKVSTKARWIRLTVDRGDADRGFSAADVEGTLEPRPANAPVASIWVEPEKTYKDGNFNGSDESGDPWYDRTTRIGDAFTMVRCYTDKYGTARLGSLDGRHWMIRDAEGTANAVINDEGTAIVGMNGSAPMYYVATKTAEKYCAPRTQGTGPRKILVLDSERDSTQWELGDDPPSKNFTFTRIHASEVTPEVLGQYDTAIFNMVCIAGDYLTPPQSDAINAWVNAGHVAIIWDSDECGAVTNYAFLPYQFKTSNPGAAGAHGKRLIEVESDALGSLDPTDKAHFFDAKAYAANDNNQIGDANTTVTKDDHWCGHLFGTNSQNVNGFMQMYAPYGKGFYIFDGFDHDDQGLPEHQRARDFEMGLTLPADMPCNVKVDMSFVLQPDQDAAFVAGKQQTLPFAMEVLANQGWKGHVALTTQGPFATTVTPTTFDMSGGTQPLRLAVTIPAKTAPGEYAVTVTATGDDGKTSAAVITFNGAAPLKKIPKKQKRIRLYGIHFDYDSAKIQPRSEPVIAEIADLMKGDRTLRFQVEGHTDSDGGAAYNLKLSQARAQSVVNDLIHRYHIASSRLVAKGFGLTRPVASNATDGGKALNRRVELLRL